MRRLVCLPQLCSWLTVAVAIFVGVGPASLLAQLPPLAQVSTNSSQVELVASTPAANAAPAPVLDPLLVELDRAIELTSKRFLTANLHSPWQIFHGILAMKRDFQLKLGDAKVNAIDWIASSEPRFDNQPLLLKTPHGAKFHPFTRKWAFEGHPAQFMALMSQSNLPVDFKFKIGNEQVAITDFLNNIMKEVNAKEEVTWVLWTLQHYLRPDAQWTNQWNEPWSIEKLVQIEAAAPVVRAACGGNHRLFALTRTRDKHLLRGGRLDGVWAEADLKIRQHVELARQLQNADGSFSAKFYESPGATNDVNERFNTSGHTMEFLSIGVPSHRLNEQWLRNAAAMLSRELVYNAQRPIDCGPLYHTLNSLMIYRDRLREQDAGWLTAQAAAAIKAAPAKPLFTPPSLLMTTPAKTSTVVTTPTTTRPAVTTPALNAGQPAATAVASTPSLSLSPLPKLVEPPKPPVEVAKPSSLPMPDDATKPADATQPVENTQPGENPKPSESVPTLTPPVTTEKPAAVPVPVTDKSVSGVTTLNPVTAPNAVKPPQGKLSTAIQRPGFARSVTILRTIDPGRVIQLRPVEQPAADGRPALLPDVAATPLDGLDLPMSNEQESFDSAPGTLKPRFDNPPRASRINVPKSAGVVESITIPPPLNDLTEDEPASALHPANEQ